jgi:DNA-binding XRE family transcriptional regulator
MRRTRLDLGHRQKDVAQIIGVTTDSVTNWEKNRSSPSLLFIPRITRFLSYMPYDTSTLAFKDRSL